MSFSNHFKNKEWASTALGDVQQWPSALTRSVQEMTRSSELMFLVVGRELVFLFNEPFAELIGPSWPDVFAMPFAEITGLDLHAIELQVQRAFGGESFIVPDFAVRSRKGEGNDVHCIAAFTPVREQFGQVFAVQGICRDVIEDTTDARLIGAQGHQAFSQAVVAVAGVEGESAAISFEGGSPHGGRNTLSYIEAPRSQPGYPGDLTAVEAFGSIVAHELNQPLAAIANYARVAKMLLKENATSNERLKECLEGISDAVSNAGSFIRSMRETLRKGPPCIEELQLRHVAQCSIESVSAACPESFLFVLSVPSSVRVVADRALVEQVFVHLLKNAYESVGSSKATVSAEVEGDVIRTIVEDDGAGLSGVTSADLFAPFRSSKRGALGVGLAICRTIIEAQGGKIAIGDGIAGGAKVTFTLPKSRADEPDKS